MTSASKFPRSIGDILLDYTRFGDLFLALLHISVYMSILEIFNLLSLILSFFYFLATEKGIDFMITIMNMHRDFSYFWFLKIKKR